MGLAGYFDESGIHQGSKVLTVAGYVSHTEQWVEFEREWRDFLAHFGIGSFHMTDFENRRGEFANFSQKQRRQISKAAVRLIHRRLVFGLSVSVNIQDLEAVLPVQRKRDALVCAYSLGVVDCTKKAETWARRAKQIDPIGYFFERGSKLARVVPKVMGSFNAEEKRRRLIGPVAWLSKATSVAFQAADILAYESYKLFSNPGQRVRHQLIDLLRPTDFGHCFAKRDLERVFDECCPPEMLEAYRAQFVSAAPRPK